MEAISFTIHGIPAPQGSKSPWGTEANPRTRPWRAEVSFVARQAWGDRLPLDGPVAVTVEFFFPFRASDLKKDGTPKLPGPHWMTTKPDSDKLERALLDSLKDAGVLRDDSRVCALRAEKYRDYKPRAVVRVVPL